MMGKTNLKDKMEYDLLGGLGEEIANSRHQPVTCHFPNQVFVYDSSQPFGKDPERAKLYSEDISSFLGLSTPLEPSKYYTFLS